MIIAMVPMGMMQVPCNEVIGVVAMGNRFVSTTRPVAMSLLVTLAMMLGRTTLRIRISYL